MKLKDYLETYFYYSEKASDVTRAAALGGIALVWVFKIDAKTAPILPKGLLIPAALLAVGLGLDMLHYVVGSITWDREHRRLEKQRVGPDVELRHSIWLKRRTQVLFYGKITSVLLGLGFLIVYLVGLWI